MSMSQNEIGIEAARAKLGELADAARADGDTTYLTRHGRRIAAIVPTDDKEPPVQKHPTDGPLQPRLTYSTYLVLHRTLMQSMPIEWQERMETCLAELDDAFSHVEKPGHFDVHAVSEHLIEDMTPEELALAGIEVEDPCGTPRYHRKEDGAELDGQEYATIRIKDPVPNPNRGRTYMQPLNPDGEVCGDVLEGRTCVLQAGFHTKSRHMDANGNWWEQSYGRPSGRLALTETAAE